MRGNQAGMSTETAELDREQFEFRFYDVRGT